MKFKVAVGAAAAVVLAGLIILFATQYTPKNVLNFVRAENMEGENGVLTITDDYDTIEAEAFAGRIELHTVVIKGETAIGERAFYNCTNLETVVLEQACDVSAEAFADCPRLKSIVSLSPDGTCADDAFSGHAGATVACPRDSAVWNVALRADMNLREIDETE